MGAKILGQLTCQNPTQRTLMVLAIARELKRSNTRVVERTIHFVVCAMYADGRLPAETKLQLEPKSYGRFINDILEVYNLINSGLLT